MSGAQRIPFGRYAGIFARQKAWDQIQKTGRSLPCSVVSADGAIITVKFEILSDFTLPQIAVPLFGPEYVRYPMKAGDKGIVIAVDAQIGAMCGLGTGTADLAQPSNLGALVFLPIGNKAWSEVDPDAVTVYAPNGVVARDTDSKSVVTITPDSIVATHGDGTVTMDDNQINATFDDAKCVLNSDQASLEFGSNTVVINEAGITITSDGETIMIANSGGMQIAWGGNSVNCGPTGVAITGVLTINGGLFTGHKHIGVTTGTGDTGGVA